MLKLNDELLEKVAGGIKKGTEEKMVLKGLKIGAFSGMIIGFAAGAGVAKKYSSKRKLRFKRKAKALFFSTMAGVLAGGSILGAGTIACINAYDFIKKNS